MISAVAEMHHIHPLISLCAGAIFTIALTLPPRQVAV